MSMQELLQLRSHLRQLVHFSVSMTGLRSEKRESNPNSVPTGQMLLHHQRPRKKARRMIRIRLTPPTTFTAAIVGWLKSETMRPNML